MNREQASAELEGLELAAVLEGQVAYARELERTLLDSDIPVMLAPKPKGACCAGGCGCGAKLQLLVRETDIPRVQQVMQQAWADAVRREVGDSNLVALRTGPASAESEEPPCPACGCAAPLVEGACSDCGLQLE